MDRLQWTLELVDRMSGPGRNAAAAFARLTDEQIAAVSAARRLAEAERKAAAALKDAESGVRSLASEDLDLVDSARKARREFEAMDRATRGLDQAATPGMTGSLLQAAFWQGLARSILNASQRIVEFGMRAAVAVGAKFFELSSWAQDTRSSLAVFAGNVSGGNAEFEKIAKTANVMGLAVQATTDSYKALRAARFGAEEAETFIKLGADLQTVVGASDEAVQSFFRATSQIKAKGRLQSEELMQIQEAVGLSQGAVYEAIGKASGVATEKVGKLLEGGKVSADMGIAAIQSAVLELVKAGNAGEATTREVSTTLRGITRLAKSGAESWMISIGERLMPAFDAVAQRAMKTLKAFDDSGKVSAFTEAVVATFERLSAAIQEAWPRIERILGRGLDGATDSLLDLSHAFSDLLDTILDAVEFIQDNWTEIKWTFAAVTTATVAAMAAIGVASAINAVKTIANVSKMAASFVGLGKAAKAARAAQLAVGAAEAVGSAASGVGGAAGAAGAGAAGAAGGASKGILASIGNALKGFGKTMLAWGKVGGKWLVAGLGAALSAIGPAIMSGLSTAGSAIATAVGGLLTAAGAAIFAAVASIGVLIWQSIELWRYWDTDALVNQIRKDWDALVGWFGGLWDRISGAVGGAVEGAYSIGAGIVSAISQGLSDAAAGLAEKAATLGHTAIQAVKDAIGWHSPPAAFVELGTGSAAAFMDSLAAALPKTIDVGVVGNVAANDVGAAPTAAAAPQSRVLDGIGAALAGFGNWLGIGTTQPVNDVTPAAQPMRAAVGSDLGYRSVAGGMTVQQGSSQAGPMSFSFNVDVTINGQASKDDATELAAQIKQQIMPSVRAEIQKTFSAAAGSAQ